MSVAYLGEADRPAGDRGAAVEVTGTAPSIGGGFFASMPAFVVSAARS